MVMVIGSVLRYLIIDFSFFIRRWHFVFFVSIKKRFSADETRDMKQTYKRYTLLGQMWFGALLGTF